MFPEAMPVPDSVLRLQALESAVQVVESNNVKGVLNAAQAFYEFLAEKPRAQVATLSLVPN